MARIYTVQITQVAVTATQDLFEINPAAGKNCKILALYMSQTTDFKDAEEEILGVLIKAGQTTSGSGGSAPTPNPTNVTDAAAGFTAEANNTTKATAGTIITHHADAWNVRMPYQLIVPEEMQIELTGSRRLTVEITAPADSITMNATLYVKEYG